jgi:hypothetical protein
MKNTFKKHMYSKLSAPDFQAQLCAHSNYHEQIMEVGIKLQAFFILALGANDQLHGLLKCSQYQLGAR